MEPLVKGKYAVEYDEVDHIYRSVMATGGLLKKPMPPYYDIKGGSMAHLFEFMADKYEDKDAMGWRDVIKVIKLICFPYLYMVIKLLSLSPKRELGSAFYMCGCV
jgi:long-chain acyl-CoA synthetase